MEYCSACRATEQGFDYEADETGHEVAICKCCGESDTRRIAQERDREND